MRKRETGLLDCHFPLLDFSQNTATVLMYLRGDIASGVTQPAQHGFWIFFAPK
jgi:hypothetical protein